MSVSKAMLNPEALKGISIVNLSDCDELPIRSPGSTRPTFLAMKKTEGRSLTMRIIDLHGFYTDVPKNYLVDRPMMIPFPPYADLD